MLHQVVVALGYASFPTLTFMDNALEADDGEETRGDGSSSNRAQDNQTQQSSCVASAFSLEEEFAGRNWAGGVGSHGGW